MTLSCGTKGLVVTVQMCQRNQKVLDRFEGMLSVPQTVKPPEDLDTPLYKIISEKFGKGLRPIDVTWEFKKLELDDE